MDLISIRRNSLILSRLKSLFTFKRFCHGFVEQSSVSRRSRGSHLRPETKLGKMDSSRCTELDSRILGIDPSMISGPSWTVLNILRRGGFKAYLVGGCVRDLLLNRQPKDYDIITNARLKQVKMQFYRSQIVGRRYPICIVHLKNTVIEVSSFETAVQGTIEKENFLAAIRPRKCHKTDPVLWRDCMRRDFTVNSLFFNPFENKVYDYANGLGDLRSLKLQTLVPAHTSFREDSARILRAVRIAARLCLSFSKEIETAVSDLSLSVLSLSQSRIMMELNYMLSYGAAQPSISLLQRLGLLEILLPFHAAYLTRQGSKYGENSTMLMKLLCNLDRVSSCEQPSHSGVWVGLFAFHMALVGKPQHPLVVLSLASLLYYGNWKEAIHHARLQIDVPRCFQPELLEATAFISDHELAERVDQLASLIQESVHFLTDADSLHKMMENFPGCTSSGLVFVSKHIRSYIAHVFGGIDRLTKHSTMGRTSFNIDYEMLRRPDVNESRFVIGKIVMETLCCAVDHEATSRGENDPIEKKIVEKQERLSSCQSLTAKNMMSIEDVFTTVEQEMQQNKEEKQQKTEKQKVVRMEDNNYVVAKLKVTGKETHLLPESQVAKMQKAVENCQEITYSKSNFFEGDVAAKHSKKRKLQASEGKVKIEDSKYFVVKLQVTGKERHLSSEIPEAKMQQAVENCEEIAHSKCNFPEGDVAAKHNNKLKSQASKSKGKGSSRPLSAMFK